MKYGLPILLGGGAMYMYYAKKHGLAHVDFSKESGVVFIPKEKYEGKESYNDYEVDDNGVPQISPDTGGLIVKDVVTVDRSVEDILNYDKSSQDYFKNQMVNHYNLAADTPAWQREFVTSHWQLTGVQRQDMENDISLALNGNAGNAAPWYKQKDGGTSYYQAWDDYGDWRMTQSTVTDDFKARWSRAVKQAYNKTDINYFGNTPAGGMNMLGINSLIKDRLAQGGHSKRQSDQLTSGLFDQHFGNGDTSGRFATVNSGSPDGIHPEVTYKTLDGEIIVGTKYTHIPLIQGDLANGTWNPGDRYNRSSNQNADFSGTIDDDRRAAAAAVAAMINP